jgi:ABC-2 type transport system ATP-binding protein
LKTNNLAVQLKAVSKRFGRQDVISDVSLTLPFGQIFGLLGPSGCGKTTLVNLIVGAHAPNSGSVEVLGGKQLSKTKQDRGFMPQDEALYLDLTAQENLRFFGGLYGMTRKQLDQEIPRVLAAVHLQDQGRKLVASYSGGMKRRLSLAVALLSSPRLLVLDEPTVGLDPKHRLELWEVFRKLANNGSCLLVTTHVMDEAASCDQIIMMQNGRIIAQGSPANLIQQTNTASLEAAFLAFDNGEQDQPEPAGTSPTVGGGGHA